MGSRRYEPFICGGRERLCNEEWYLRRKDEIRETVREKYESDLAGASFYEELVVRWKMWRELRREIEALAPGRGLYIE